MKECEECRGKVGDVFSMSRNEIGRIPHKCNECMTVEELNFMSDLKTSGVII